MKRRPALLAVLALASVSALMSVTGVFAEFGDTATGGENDVTSADSLTGVDLQIAPYIVDPFDPQGAGACGDFTDDTETALFEAELIEVGFEQELSGLYCVRDLGTTGAHFTVGAVDVVEAEAGCTGKERDFDDTCGEGPGELSSVAEWQWLTVDCATGELGTSHSGTYALKFPQGDSFASAPLPTDGSPVCVRFGVYIVDEWGVERLSAAQSDAMSWRFRFLATPSA
jgi:hypothetical protein